MRELKAQAERFALGLDDTIMQAGTAAPEATDLALPDRLAAYEAHLIREALDRSDGSAARAAAVLGIPLRTLNEKMSRRGLQSYRRRQTENNEQ